MSPEFRALIDRLVQRYGNAQRLSAAVGMTLSAFQRGRAQGTFSTETCLRLAATTGEPPSEVLRAAGKGSVADLLETLYGRHTVSASDRQLLQRWAALSPKSRDSLTAVMRELLKDKDEHSNPRRKGAGWATGNRIARIPSSS